jgi:beta-glucanase (GH16 family)
MNRVTKSLIILIPALVGCSSAETDSDLVWAVNIGGPAYQAIDGTYYQAEESVAGGTVERLQSVKGSQDPTLYQSYRRGDIVVKRAIANGVHDITFHFAEPDDIEGGDRLFDVLVNDQVVIKELDVMSFRDGKIHSALTVTAPNVTISDSEFRVRFEPAEIEALLSALVVRSKNRPKKNWQLVWGDEFDNSGAPDPENWNIEEWESRVVNSEDQAYTASARNLRVEDGHLIVEAHKEDHGVAKYTSGRMQSSGKRDFLYGRFEARAKVPKGQGNWAAIWMLPSNPFTYATNCSGIKDWQGNAECDAWPNSGEIDILEHVGYLDGHVHGTVHNVAYYFRNWQQRKGRVILDDLTDAFHIYAVEWFPDRIDMYVDDVLYFSYVNENNGWREWPYDQPFHWIVNLAIGGDWGRAGGPIDDSMFPQQMLVDYVRVYQLGD